MFEIVSASMKAISLVDGRLVCVQENTNAHNTGARWLTAEVISH